MKDVLSLKWGGLKSCQFVGKNAEKCKALAKRWENALSLKHGRRSKLEQRLVCEIIDLVNCRWIYLDWIGKHVGKSEAKKYVMNYGKQNC